MSDDGLTFIRNLKDWDGGSFSLDNIRAVMACLGNPQDRPRSVHVAGTNGKGSVCAALNSIMRAARVRVGLTISPHLELINERIVINGKDITDSHLAEVSSLVRSAAELLKVPLSKHEAITAAAFVAFGDLDWTIVEVGLGGRLDASNVLGRPQVSVITTIDYDHEHLLGHKIEEIASEKAAIIRPRQNVVVGKLREDAFTVISRVAAQAQANLVRYGEDYWVTALGGGEFCYCNTDGLRIRFVPALAGYHQVENMAVAIATALAAGFRDERVIAEGVASTTWPGRLESFQHIGREVILDCAHNPAGVGSLISFLDCRGLSRLEVIFGVLRDKRWTEMADMLAPYIVKWNIVEPQNPRALPAEVLVEYIEQRGGEARAVDGAGIDDVVGFPCQHLPLLVTGSMYLVGRARNFLQHRSAQG